MGLVKADEELIAKVDKDCAGPGEGDLDESMVEPEEGAEDPQVVKLKPSIEDATTNNWDQVVIDSFKASLENAKKASTGPGYLTSDRRLNDMRTTTRENDVELMIFTVSQTCAALKRLRMELLHTRMR